MGPLTLERLERPGGELLHLLAQYDREAFGAAGLRTYDLACVAWAGGLYIARKQGEIVGSVQLIRSFSDPGLFWLVGFYVRPAWQRRGLGRSLLRGVLTELGWLGGTGVMLTVALCNQRALSLYLDFGFTIEETVPDFFGNGEERLVLKYLLQGQPGSV